VDLDLDGFRTYLRRRGSPETTVSTYVSLLSHGPERVRSRTMAPKSRGVMLAAWRAYARFRRRSGDPAGDELLEDLADVRLPPLVRQRPQLPLPRPLFDLLRDAIDEDDDLAPPERAALGVMANRGLRSIDIREVKREAVSGALKTGVLSFVAKGGRRLEFGVNNAYRPYLEMLDVEFAARRARDADVADLLVARGTKAAARSTSAARAIARSLKVVTKKLPLAKHGVELADVHPHILRRTYATLFYEACGRDVVQLKQHMGWSNIQTAVNYVDHDRRAELDEIAEGMLLRH
jgi:site-specific recombinase XerC